MTTCTGPDCDRPATVRGLCDAHAKQARRGRPLAPLRPRGGDGPCDTCGEAEFLALCGEAFEQVAARLGMTAPSLERHLHRHQRGDLLARLPRLEPIPPTPYR